MVNALSKIKMSTSIMPIRVILLLSQAVATLRVVESSGVNFCFSKWCELTNLALIALTVAPVSVSAGVEIPEILIEISYCLKFASHKVKHYHIFWSTMFLITLKFTQFVP